MFVKICAIFVITLLMRFSNSFAIPLENVQVQVQKNETQPQNVLPIDITESQEEQLTNGTEKDL